MAQRVLHLLRPGPGGGLLPRNVIAFTFTDKAAAEVKDRIVSRCREAMPDIAGLAEMLVGTIHAFCLDLLKTEVPKYARFGVLNAVQQGLFVVTGMTGLFGTAEAEAARQLFYFMGGRPDPDRRALRDAWVAADLGLDPGDLERAFDGVERSRAALTDPEQKRWG